MRSNDAAAQARRYAPWLLTLLVLFCLRVVGQAVVAVRAVPFLPPMDEWYSGLLPYRWLVPFQIAIVIGFGKVCRDFRRGEVQPSRAWGRRLLAFGGVYAGAMVVRYVVRMALYPEARWFGQTIPIVFHLVLASFILLVGHFHRTAAAEGGAAQG